MHSTSLPPFHWWPPFYQWRARRRLVVASIVTLMTWILASAAWRMTDSSGARATTALAEAKQHLATAQRQIAGLPALRKAAQAEASAAPYNGASPGSPAANPADDIRFLSQLAAETGVTLLSLEPGAENRKEPLAGRFLKLTAQTDFAHLNDFFRQLHTLPILVVPAELAIKRDGDGLAMNAVFQLFDELRAPAPASASASENSPATPAAHAGKQLDPFTPPAGDAPGSRALRLAGVIEDGTHAIALMETPDGMQTVKRGDELGGERVASIGMPEIVLSHGAAMRTLTWEEERRIRRENVKKRAEKGSGKIAENPQRPSRKPRRQKSAQQE
jgi:Tfp pilus assembly protein PilO